MVMNINQIFEQALIAHQEGRLEEAEHLYRLILKKNSEHLDSNNNLGVILQHHGKLEEAKEYYKKAIDIKPDFAEAHNNLGNILKDLGDPNESLKSYRKAIEINPTLAEAHNNFGDALDKLGKIEEAEVSYKKAIELKPNYSKAHFNLGNMLLMRNRIEEAEKACKKAIELKPDYAEAHNNFGNILNKLKKYDQAETSYKKAIELKPDFALSYHNLGILMSNRDKLDKAEIYLNKAIELESNSEYLLVARANILYKKKNFKLALVDLGNCNTQASRLETIYCLFALGRTKEIYEIIEKNSELDSESIKIAAFSSFISHKEKKVTAHKFCNNPIDFISTSNLSTYLENSNSFIAELIDELKNIKTRWEPDSRTTNKGFQSFENLFENPTGKLKALQSIIIDELDSYYLKFKDESCTYIKKWPTIKRLHGWFVILKQQGYQSSHMHAGGWLSGVIYLKVVPHLEKNEGAIELSLNDKNYSDPNSPKVIHKPKVGDIILFPSSLHHKTIPFMANEDRISIAFDLWPRGPKL